MKTVKKVLAIVLVMLMIVSVLPVATASTGGKTQSDAVAWANAQVGKSLDYDGVYGAQCVDFTKYYYAFLGVSPVRGNGCDYATNSLPSGWSRIKYYSGFVPQAGDIAVWTYASSAYGHVAIVTSATSSSMNVVEQNGSTHITRSHTYSYSYGTFYGVIRPDFVGGGSVDTTPSISYATIPESNYNIVNKAGGKYLNAYASAGAANTSTNICASNADNSAEQNFKIQAYGNNQYYIRSLSNGNEYCVNANSPNNVVTDGANVHLYTYNTVASKLWYFEGADSGYYIIRNVMNPSLVLTAVSADTRANVCVKSYTGSDLQKWKLINLNASTSETPAVSTNASTKVAESNFNIVSKSSGNYLNAYANPGQATSAYVGFGTGSLQAAYGTDVCISYSDGTNEQKWKLEHYGNNQYYIRSLSNDGQYCVNAYSPSNVVSDGCDVRLYTHNNVASKLWSFEEDGNGYYVIRNVMNSNLVLTAVDNNNRADVIVKSYSGYDNQKWKLVDLINTTTTTVTTTPKQYTIDLNSYYNNSENGYLDGVGTADIYINDVLIADDVTDFCAKYEAGTTYEIKDIKGTNGYSYTGVYIGSLSGKVDNSDIGVALKFEKTADTISYSNELDTEQVYNLINKSSGKYLNAYSEETKVTVKTNVCASNGDGTHEQEFKIQSIGDGKYLIRSLSNANLYCVDVYTPSNVAENGANVWMYYNTDFASKHWYFEGVGDGYYVIRNALNINLVLAPESNAHRANVTVQTYTGSDLQKWKLATVESNYTDSSTGAASSQNDNINKLNSYLRNWINVSVPYSMNVNTSKTEVIDYNNPPATMDCSSFTSSVYLTVFGVNIGRNTRIQQYRGAPVGTDKIRNQDYSDLIIGDLILFDWGGDGVPDHVAIYSGNGNYVHMTTTNKVIETSFSYKSRYNNVLTVRRIIQQDGSLWHWIYTSQGDEDVGTVVLASAAISDLVAYYFDKDEQTITGIPVSSTYGEMLLNTDYEKIVVCNSSGGELLVLNREELTTGEYFDKDIRVLSGTIVKLYDADGNICFTGECIVDGENENILYGDVNGDAEIDVLDILETVKYVNGVPNVEIDMNASDTYKDGTIDVLDVLNSVKYLNGWDITLG